MYVATKLTLMLPKEAEIVEESTNSEFDALWYLKEKKNLTRLHRWQFWRGTDTNMVSRLASKKLVTA